MSKVLTIDQAVSFGDVLLRLRKLKVEVGAVISFLRIIEIEDNGTDLKAVSAIPGVVSMVSNAEVPILARRPGDAASMPELRTYRLLDDGDVISRCDEYLEDDCETWTAVRNEIGVRWKSGVLKPFRRPTNTEAL